MRHNYYVGDQLIAKRRAEKFKRIKCSTLAKLLAQHTVEESIYNLGQGDGMDSISVVAGQNNLNNAAEETKDDQSVYSMRSGVS